MLFDFDTQYLRGRCCFYNSRFPIPYTYGNIILQVCRDTPAELRNEVDGLESHERLEE